jgi:hypothetical protein
VHEEYIEQASEQEGKEQAGRKAGQSPPVQIMDDKAWLEEFNRKKEEK